MNQQDNSSESELKARYARSTSRIRVVVIDDHPVIRAGLRQMVAEAPDITIVGEADSGAEAARQIRALHADLAVLTSRLSGGDGLDILRDIRGLYPRLPVLTLSVHEDPEFGVRALRAGASGYLSSGSQAEEILSAIRKVAAGGVHISPDLAEQLAYGVVLRRSEAPHKELSDREYQVLKLLGAGMSVTEAAEHIGLSPKTVSTYRRRLMDKMGMKTDLELTRYVVREQLLEF